MYTLSDNDAAHPLYWQEVRPPEIISVNNLSNGLSNNPYGISTPQFEALVQQAIHQALEKMIEQPGKIAFFAHPVESNPVIIL